jgi:hypothetical protein
LQSLLNGRAAAQGVERFPKSEEERIAHGHQFLAVMFGHGTADQAEVFALDGFEIDAIADLGVGAQVSISLGRAGADNVRENQGNDRRRHAG